MGKRGREKPILKKKQTIGIKHVRFQKQRRMVRYKNCWFTVGQAKIDLIGFACLRIVHGQFLASKVMMVEDFFVFALMSPS